jgi:hypothetical protein
LIFSQVDDKAFSVDALRTNNWGIDSPVTAVSVGVEDPFKEAK